MCCITHAHASPPQLRSCQLAMCPWLATSPSPAVMAFMLQAGKMWADRWQRHQEAVRRAWLRGGCDDASQLVPTHTPKAAGAA
jgi:hypothetical protein